MSNLKIYTSTETGYVPGLNAIRLLGAMMVVFTHLGSYVWFKSFGLVKQHTYISGTTGVIAFFVLSGFLVTCLAVDEIRREKGFSFVKFFIRRALRLFPLYYIAIISIFILDLIGLTSADSGAYLYAIFYAYNMIPKELQNGLLASFSTLAIEEQFYILFGLTMYVLGYSARLLKTEFTIYFMILLVVASILARHFYWETTLVHSDTHYVYNWLPQASLPILVGCFTALLLKLKISTRIFELISKNPPLNGIFFAICLFNAAYLYIKYPFGGSFYTISVSISLFCVVFYLYRDSFLSKAAEWSPLVYGGTISYGIYVWQAVVNGTGSGSRWIEDPFISTTLVFILTVLSYHFMEKPLSRFRFKFR